MVSGPLSKPSCFLRAMSTQRSATRSATCDAPPSRSGNFGSRGVGLDRTRRSSRTSRSTTASASSESAPAPRTLRTRSSITSPAGSGQNTTSRLSPPAGYSSLRLLGGSLPSPWRRCSALVSATDQITRLVLLATNWADGGDSSTSVLGRPTPKPSADSTTAASGSSSSGSSGSLSLACWKTVPNESAVWPSPKRPAWPGVFKLLRFSEGRLRSHVYSSGWCRQWWAAASAPPILEQPASPL